MATSFLFLATIGLWFVRDGACSSYLLTWFGLAPNQIVMSALAVVMVRICMMNSLCLPLVQPSRHWLRALKCSASTIAACWGLQSVN